MTQATRNPLPSSSSYLEVASNILLHGAAHTRTQHNITTYYRFWSYNRIIPRTFGYHMIRARPHRTY
jgi:hypothetical protein